jgi:hypothetical protein
VRTDTVVRYRSRESPDTRVHAGPASHPFCPCR